MKLKVFLFTGLAMFVDGMWGEKLAIASSKEVDDLVVPEEIGKMGKTIVGAIPKNPEEGMNEIELLVICETIEEANEQVEKMSEKFGEIHNRKPTSFVDMLKGLLETLKEINSDMEKEKENHEIGHDSPS